MTKPNDLDNYLNNTNKKISASDVIDNKGTGSMPINVDIDYFGFVKQSTTYDFLDAVTRRVYDDSIEFLVNHIKNGGKIAPPTLFVEWLKDEKLWMITGHEGRGRAKALQKLEIDEFLDDHNIPIHIIPYKLRARDINEEKLNADFIKEDFFQKYEYPEDKKFIKSYICKL